MASDGPRRLEAIPRQAQIATAWHRDERAYVCLHSWVVWSTGFTFVVTVVAAPQAAQLPIPEWRGDAPPGEEDSVIDLWVEHGHTRLSNCSDSETTHLSVLTGRGLPQWAEAQFWVPLIPTELVLTVGLDWPRTGIGARFDLPTSALQQAHASLTFLPWG